MPNYHSYYNDTPTYSYLTGNNPSGVPRLGSKVVFLNGHANSSVINFSYTNSSGVDVNYGINIYSNNPTNNRIGLQSFSLYGCELMMFVGCSTGSGSSSLADVAVNRGVLSSIGFTNSIISRFGEGPLWLTALENRLAAGVYLDVALQDVVSLYPTCTLSTYLKVCGLGTNRLTPPVSKSDAPVNSYDTLQHYDSENFDNQLESSMAKGTLSDFAIRKIVEIYPDFDISKYEVTYNTLSDNNDNKKVLATVVYKLDDNTITNAALMMNYDNNSLVSISKNCYFDQISDVNENTVKRAVAKYMDSRVYSNYIGTVHQGLNPTHRFVYNYGTQKLAFEAYNFKELPDGTFGDNFYICDSISYLDLK